MSQGVEGLGSTYNDSPLASRLAGRVDFTKVEGSLSRTQPLFDRFSAYGSVYGQYGFTALLSPEQCGYGGRYFGRAYDPSEFLGDSCVFALGELRYDLPRQLPQLTTAQLYGFVVYGDLFTRDAALGTPSHIAAASFGAGLRLGALDKLNIDLQAAKGDHSPYTGWRFFFVVSARY